MKGLILILNGINHRNHKFGHSNISFACLMIPQSETRISKVTSQISEEKRKENSIINHVFNKSQSKFDLQQLVLISAYAVTV